jgi:hypothetical protein
MGEMQDLGNKAGRRRESGNVSLSTDTMTRMALSLLALGILWRTIRYLLRFPIWGDEALLALNFAWFDYGQLTSRLENCQIAPLWFLWGERTAFVWLGPGEFSLRLLPFLAGLASLVLYWQLTGLVLRPTARLFAVGFLAVAHWPVSMCTLIKPYSFDLLMSLVLLLPAVQWMRRPDQTRWLIGLVILVPAAMLGSYPSAFVGGGISLAIAYRAWRHGWSTRCWFATYNLTLLAGFACAYAIGVRQLDTATSGVTTRAGMAAYWAHGFPPDTALSAIKWFVLQTAGQMTAYPLGASNGGSALTALFCVSGVAWWARRRQWTWVILLGVPVFLNLIAAIVHGYPYGGSGRLNQHLAAPICISAGLGLSALLERIRRPLARRVRGPVAIAILFALVGLGGLVRDVARPYRDQGCVWMRSTMKAIREQVLSSDRIVICGTPDTLECVFTWYWVNEGARVTWNSQLPPLGQSGARIWGFHWGREAESSCRQMTEALRRQDSAWQLARRLPYSYQSPKPKDLPQSCELFCFERAPDQNAHPLTGIQNTPPCLDAGGTLEYVTKTSGAECDNSLAEAGLEPARPLRGRGF